MKTRKPRKDRGTKRPRRKGNKQGLEGDDNDDDEEQEEEEERPHKRPKSKEIVPAEIELLTGRIEAEATRMGVLVEDLLLLARLNQERALDITDVDLLVLAADAIHDAQARDPGRPVRHQ